MGSVAARVARKSELIDDNMHKTLTKLDMAFAFSRHVNEPNIQKLDKSVICMLAGPSRGVHTRSTEESNKTEGVSLAGTLDRLEKDIANFRGEVAVAATAAIGPDIE